MNPPSSSTSSSKADAPSTVRAKLSVVAWFVVALLAVDVSLGWVFEYPQQVGVKPSRLQKYFDYGQSIESRILRMIGPDNDSASLLSKAGWWEFVSKEDIESQPVDPNATRINIFGMSFANHLAQAMISLQPGAFDVEMYDGPAAPLNHAYALYQRNRGQTDERIVILGVLDSSLPALETMTGATWMTDSPPPYTYPRYLLENGKLKKIEPVASSLNELRRIMTDDPEARQRMLQQLEKHDAFYHPFVYQHDLWDHSTLARLIRRAWATRQFQSTLDRYRNASGFKTNTDLIPVAQAILIEFAASVRADDKIPIVLLFNTLNYGDQLYQTLGPALKQQGIPYLSSHTIIPPTDRKNFISDGHYTPESDLKLAQALIELIEDISGASVATVSR